MIERKIGSPRTYLLWSVDNLLAVGFLIDVALSGKIRESLDDGWFGQVMLCFEICLEISGIVRSVLLDKVLKKYLLAAAGAMTSAF